MYSERAVELHWEDDSISLHRGATAYYFILIVLINIAFCAGSNNYSDYDRVEFNRTLIINEGADIADESQCVNKSQLGKNHAYLP